MQICGVEELNENVKMMVESIKFNIFIKVLSIIIIYKINIY